MRIIDREGRLYGWATYYPNIGWSVAERKSKNLPAWEFWVKQ